MSTSASFHAQLCTAVEAAVAVERLPHAWTADDRYPWLTEIELAARVRNGLLLGRDIAETDVKVQGSGRRVKGASSLPDIVVGKDSQLVEVVYLFAKAAPSPGWPLSGDLDWLKLGGSRHVVAFIPRMRAGYRVQKNPTPYDLSHKPLSLGPGERLLTDCLQMGGLNAQAKALCSGIFETVQNPCRGNRDRWTLAESAGRMNDPQIQRSIVGRPTDPLWGIVWSSEAAQRQGVGQTWRDTCGARSS